MMSEIEGSEAHESMLRNGLKYIHTGFVGNISVEACSGSKYELWV